MSFKYHTLNWVTKIYTLALIFVLSSMGEKISKIESEKVPNPENDPSDEKLLKLKDLLLNQNFTLYFFIPYPTDPTYNDSEYCFIENNPDAICFGEGTGMLSDTKTDDYETINLIIRESWKGMGFDSNQKMYTFHGFSSLSGKGYVIHYPWTFRKFK